MRYDALGLTKMVAKLSREGSYRKGLEVFEALPAVGLVADVALTNAAISALDKGESPDHAEATPVHCSIKSLPTASALPSMSRS